MPEFLAVCVIKFDLEEELEVEVNITIPNVDNCVMVTLDDISCENCVDEWIEFLIDVFECVWKDVEKVILS